jgi:hypothetical protein
MSTRTATGATTVIATSVARIARFAAEFAARIARIAVGNNVTRTAFAAIIATTLQAESFERVLQTTEGELPGAATVVGAVARTAIEPAVARFAVASNIARSARLRVKQVANFSAQLETGRVACNLVARIASKGDFVARSASNNWFTRIAVGACSVHQILETFEQVSSFHHTSVTRTTGVHAIRVTGIYRKTSDAH